MDFFKLKSNKYICNNSNSDIKSMNASKMIKNQYDNIDKA